MRRAVFKLPGPKPDSFLNGNIALVPKDRQHMNAYLMELQREYGGVMRFSFGPVPVVLCFDPQFARVVMSTSKHSTKGYFYFMLTTWLGTGLLTSQGTKWKNRRRMITPAFHFDILKRFLEVMNEQTDVMINKMEEKSQQGPVEAFELITLCTLDIICETAMGKKVHAQQTEGQNEYVEAVYQSTKLIMDRGMKPWQLFEFLYKHGEEGQRFYKVLEVLHKFTRKVIKERRELLAREKKELGEGESAKKSRPAFLDILLTAESDGKPLDDEDIREEVDTFMFEGNVANNPISRTRPTTCKSMIFF